MPMKKVNENSRELVPESKAAANLWNQEKEKKTESNAYEINITYRPAPTSPSESITTLNKSEF